MLREIEFPHYILPTARYYHKQWDGLGYPCGLRGEEIPQEARIFAVAYAFDAITSKRPYSSARTYDEATGTLREDSGTTFDPQIVEAFLNVPHEEWDHLRESVIRDLQYASNEDFMRI